MTSLVRPRLVACTLLALSLIGPAAPATAQAPDPGLAQQVEIIRTAYGVPHIRAQNMKAAGYGLAYVQLEDYGARVVNGLASARGEMGRIFGRDSIEGDFENRLAYRRAVETYPMLDQDTRDMYDGFAAGVNRYITKHRDEFPASITPSFTGYDVAARDIGQANPFSARRFLARLNGRSARREPGNPDEGSNAWAFAPSRTRSGHAILVRNPHLNWNAGYYEGQLTVPGKFDFYGDFRLGGPFGVIGGFNRYLGWSTTNNAPDLEEIYALDADPDRPDHFLFDGTSLPLRREAVTVEFRNGDAMNTETREFWFTHLGPVIARQDGKIYVLRAAGDGEFRTGDQFLRMMKATTLDEWKDAMRIRARTSSNFTYADRAGNIFYLWNASIPSFPRPNGGDTLAIPAKTTADVWTHYVPFDSLPMLRNPKGGYIHNENDPFHYTNLHQPFSPKSFPDYFPQPDLRLRSQMSLALIDNNRKLSLEDVINLKFSPRMMLAERLKDELVAAVRASSPSPRVDSAAAMLATWDGTTAVDSRGGVLFEEWWRQYQRATDSSHVWREPWSTEAPATTPRGLGDPKAAATAFATAVEQTAKKYGAWNVSWGEVHRVRRGKVDVPTTGCTGAIGCFRVLQFREDADGKLAAMGGDGWVLAIEFADVPRAYSILAYGETNREDSPHYDDQAQMFAEGKMKRVYYTEADVNKAAEVRYHPGEER